MAERSVVAHGQKPPQVGDIIERDGQRVVVLESKWRTATPQDRTYIGAEEEYGDTVMELVWRPVDDRLGGVR